MFLEKLGFREQRITFYLYLLQCLSFLKYAYLKKRTYLKKNFTGKALYIHLYSPKQYPMLTWPPWESVCYYVDLYSCRGLPSHLKKKVQEKIKMSKSLKS